MFPWERNLGRPFTIVTHVLCPDTALSELDTLRANIAKDLDRIVEAGGSVCFPNGGREIPRRERAWLYGTGSALRYGKDGTPFFRWALTTPRALLAELRSLPVEEVETLFRDIMERDAATLRELGYDVSIVD